MARFGAFAPRSGPGALDVRQGAIPGLNIGGPNTQGITIGAPQTGGFTPPLPVTPPSQVPAAQEPPPSALSPNDRAVIEGIVGRAEAMSPQEKQAYLKAQLHEFAIRLDITPAARAEVQDIVYHRNRYKVRPHSSPLDRLAQGMQAVEASTSGFLMGYKKSLGGVDPKTGRAKEPGFMRSISPWAEYHAIGAGFSEVPKAVSAHYTWADAIKESNDPSSLAYHWAMPIGLGMSVLYDPTTYLSAGTSTASKHLAYQFMAIQGKEASAAAKASIQAGEYGGDWNRLSEATMAERVKRGHALSMGDALDTIREQHLDLKQSIRSHGGILMPDGTVSAVRKRDKAAAWMAPMTAKGGRGVRFGGARIPGTGELGEAGAKYLRRGAKGSSAFGDIAQGTGAALVPDYKARHVEGDMQRASLLVEMAIYKKSVNTVQADIAHEVRSLREVKVYPERPAPGQPPTESVPHVIPTAEEVGAEPHKQFFSVLVNEKDPTDVIVGAPGSGHSEIQDIAARRKGKSYIQGTGVFENGRVAKVNIDFPEDARHMTPEQFNTAAHQGAESHYLDPESWAALNAQQRAEVNAVGRGYEVLKVSPAERQNLLKEDYHNLPPGALRNLHNNVNEEAQFYIEQAVGKGANREELENRWRYMSQTGYKDPLAAIYDFKLTATTKMMAGDFTKRMLEDARFSMPMVSGAAKREVEQAIVERPRSRGPLRPTYIGNRSVVTTADGVEHVMPQVDAKDFVAGVVHDAKGNPIHVDDIRQVRDSADGDLAWREHDFVATGEGEKLLHQAPHGYQVYVHGSKRYAVVDAMADALKKINNPVDQHLETKKIFNIINAPQNWWKIYATSPNPSFHVMNLLGAIWNNQLAGVYNPLDYGAAIGALYRGRKEEAAQRGERWFFGVPESSAKGREAQSLLSELENRGGGGRSSFLFADISRGGDKALGLETEKDIARIGKKREVLGNELLGKALMPPEGSSVYKTARFYGTKRGRQVAGAAITGTGNPFGLLLLAPEIARAGQKVTGGVENVVRLAPFMKYSNDPLTRQIIHKAGPISIDGMTHPRFSKAEQAIMYDLGASLTTHFQFDYTNLTPFEQTFAKTVFPFWSYYKKNFVLQAGQLAKQPRKYEAALRFMNFMNQQGEDLGPYKQILPDYFNNIQAFQVPVPDFARKKLGLPADQPLFLNPKMPFLSLNLIPNMWDIINDPHETTSQKVLETIAPVMGNMGPLSLWGVKPILEAGTGHNLGLNRPIDYQRVSSNDYRQSYVDAPSWSKYLPKAAQRFMGIHYSKRKGKLIQSATAHYITEQMTTPFLNNYGQAIPVGGATKADKGRARADTISWLTGTRLIPVDILRITRNDAYALKNQLEAKQSELRQEGKELSDKDYYMLDDVKYDLEGINDAWDQREGIKR